MSSSLKRKFLQIFHSTPVEQAKWAAKGQFLRLVKSSRYSHLKKSRPPRKELAKYKKDVLQRVRTSLKEAGIKPKKVFGVIKTLGSLNRKEKRARLVFPKSFNEYVGMDYIGVTVVVGSVEEIYKVLGVLKPLGEFTKFFGRKNPLDYMANDAKSFSLAGSNREAVKGIFEFEGVPVKTHVRILTEEAFQTTKEQRGLRMKQIKKEIQSAGHSP